MKKLHECVVVELLQIALSDPSRRIAAVRILAEGESSALEARSRELLRTLALAHMSEEISDVVSRNPCEELESVMVNVVESCDGRVQVRGLLNAGLWKRYESVIQSLKSSKVQGAWGAFLRDLSLYRVMGDESFLDAASEWIVAAQRDGRPIDTAADDVVDENERTMLDRMLPLRGGERIGGLSSLLQSAASILASVRWQKNKREG